MSDEKLVSIYVSRTCPACKAYIYQLVELCDKHDFSYETYILEYSPIKTYKALNEARENGAIIDHAPFITIKSPSKYKAIGGILDAKTITKLLKKYG